jgi:hypothetical protein
MKDFEGRFLFRQQDTLRNKPVWADVCLTGGFEAVMRLQDRASNIAAARIKADTYNAEPTRWVLL